MNDTVGHITVVVWHGNIATFVNNSAAQIGGDNKCESENIRLCSILKRTSDPLGRA